MARRMLPLLLKSFLLLLCIHSFVAYRFGLGVFDITGPAADVNMMGYAKFSQRTHGIHTRLFSRAFLIQETSTSRPILFINVDIGMPSQILKDKVISQLRELYGQKFDHQNVLISATHTHSGPGGYFSYTLYSIASLGFVRETFDALVKGILMSVKGAMENITDGQIFIAEGDLLDASVNRSPASYEENPQEERNMYTSDVDTKMITLKFVDSNGHSVGMLNWFAVHATSMNNSNTLITGDNKGLASLMFEERMNGDRLLGQGPFVAAFAQANEGDVSPNTRGPRCIDTGKPCDLIHSNCDGHTSACIAFGPGRDMFESTKIIALKQMQRAWELFSVATEELTGPVAFAHQFVDMTNISVQYQGRTGFTCKPAMGYSFAAGTTDGPGDFNFAQGTTGESWFWNLIRSFIKTPSAQLRECQKPKPILFATGEMEHPVPWQPAIVETQLLRIGQLIIVGLPGEFTTMSGRRIRSAVEKVALQHPNLHVALAGLSNIYSSYITTPEEYELQRYEGASTIYGPLTLPAYVQQYEKLATALLQDKPLPLGPGPPNYLDKVLQMLPPVLIDTVPWGQEFGDVILQPQTVYDKLDDVVVVRFHSANPRNDIKQNDTFLKVERYDNNTHTWITCFTDANWETRFRWDRQNALSTLLGQSFAEITWEVSRWDGRCIPGIYRIKHFGTAKPSLFHPTLLPFQGTSRQFCVTCGKSMDVC